ncbi:hypothetical protein QP150_00045 [Sphingomonas sp. 22L2VL55-3]
MLLTVLAGDRNVCAGTQTLLDLSLNRAPLRVVDDTKTGHRDLNPFGLIA